MLQNMDKGFIECEFFEDASAALEGSSSWASCTKNGGHLGFIPYPDFQIGHLPSAWQRREVFQETVDLAERTVKLTIGHTSTDRPDVFRFSNLNRPGIVRSGSGWMEKVVHRSDVPCPCSDCSRDGVTPQETWFEAVVITARHVVFNEEEAKSTLVDLHYDTKESRKDGSMQRLQAYCFLLSEGVEDACSLACAAHDIKKAQLEFPLQLTLIPSTKPNIGKTDLCVVISHPHGNPKKITLGEVKDFNPSGSEFLVRYDSGTCPGSSGAPVIVFYEDGNSLVVHSMGNVTDGINQGSCVAFKMK
ncbi:hypothetical protein EGW08_010131 [Elysia chlorotica]|uniref:Peptidase S1 domain-containing protein n=1 Tax=Elysia chlorotica TaxID=188477 RepID=A0A433TKI6_ELYCH|nr:hypothetical protein EGW08_010131 [Elysia chlorotica]